MKRICEGAGKFLLCFTVGSLIAFGLVMLLSLIMPMEMALMIGCLLGFAIFAVIMC